MLSMQMFITPNEELWTLNIRKSWWESQGHSGPLPVGQCQRAGLLSPFPTLFQDTVPSSGQTLPSSPHPWPSSFLHPSPHWAELHTVGGPNCAQLLNLSFFSPTQTSYPYLGLGGRSGL